MLPTSLLPHMLQLQRVRSHLDKPTYGSQSRVRFSAGCVPTPTCRMSSLHCPPPPLLCRARDRASSGLAMPLMPIQHRHYTVCFAKSSPFTMIKRHGKEKRTKASKLLKDGVSGKFFALFAPVQHERVHLSAATAAVGVFVPLCSFLSILSR
jgi:hypothetical protein